MSSCPSLLPPGTRALGKVSFLGCELVWNVLNKHPRACVSLFLPLKLHLSPPESCAPGTPLPAEVPRRLHSQEGSFSWGPQPRGSGYSVTLPWSSWPDGRVTSLGCTGQTRRSGVRGSRCRAERRAVPTLRVQPWDSDLLWFQGSDSISSQGGWRE